MGTKKKRPREVDPQAKFETRRVGIFCFVFTKKGAKKKRPREVDPQAKFETRKEKKKRPREVDPQAKFETRKGQKKNDPEKWIHKRNLRPEREKKTTQRSRSTSEI